MCVIFTNEWQAKVEFSRELGVTAAGAKKLEWKYKLCDYKFRKKETRAIRHYKLANGRRRFRPLKM